MNFKLNALVAAALLAAAGSANAAIDPGLNGNGEIWFAVYDSVAQKSFSFDTGVYMNDFVGTGTNYNYNFASDANWTTFAAGSNSANWLWMVGAESGNGLTTSRVFTTDNAATVSIPKGGPGAMAANGTNFTAAQIAGTNYAVNGSAVKVAGDSGYFGDPFMTGSWGTKFTPDASTVVGNSLNFFSITGAAGLGNVSGVKFGATAADVWTLSSAGVLNYGAAAPVPEADTYALMLAGLGLVGFMARRRLAA
jgi:hypothetical protein